MINHPNKNKGFSLFELIITLLISTIVVLAVVFFVSTGMRQYQRNTIEVTLQMESQTAMNQIHDLLLEAEFYQYESDLKVDGTSYQTVMILASNNICYVIAVDMRDKTMYLMKEEIDDTDIDLSLEMTQEIVAKVDKKKHLLAQYVTKMEIKPDSFSTAVTSKQLVHVALELEMSDKVFKATDSITIRNGLQ